MRTGFGTAIIMLFMFLVALGLALGLLLSNNELLRPQQAHFDRQVATEKWRLEQQRAQDQLLIDRQRQAQDLETQRALGAALVQVTQYGGVVVSYALAMAILMLSGSSAWRMTVQGIVALRESRAQSPARSVRPVSKSLAPEPLPFPDRRPVQSVRKEP